MKSESYKAIFNSGKSIDVEEDSAFRVIEEKGDKFVVEYNQVIYNIDVVEFDQTGKTYRLIINNKPVNLSLKSKLDQLIDELGLKSQKEENVSQVKAPMPGLVIELKVSVGDQVEKDDPLLILEAMKMENVIKSKGSGIVKNIHIAVNDKVEKAQMMIEFE